MATVNNSINSKFQNNTVGFTMGGGSTTVRNLTVAGASDFTLTNPNSTSSVFSFPAQSTDTLLGYSQYATAGDVLYATSANTPAALAIGTNGQVLTSNGTIPTWATAAFGPLPLISSLFAATMAINTAYQTIAATPVILTLPATAAAGSELRVTAYGTGGFVIAQAAGQTIHFGNGSTTTGTGGSLASTVQYDSVNLYCAAANTDWVVTASVGNITVT